MIISSKNMALLSAIAMLAGCGLESAGSAAVAAKQQAAQAEQAHSTLEGVRKNLDASAAQADENRKKAEQAADN